MRLKIETPFDLDGAPSTLELVGHEYVLFPPTGVRPGLLVERKCPHAGADLKIHGRVDDQCRVFCLRHGCGWDAETTVPVEGRCSTPLNVYRVTEETDGLYVDLPSLS